MSQVLRVNTGEWAQGEKRNRCGNRRRVAQEKSRVSRSCLYAETSAVRYQTECYKRMDEKSIQAISDLALERVFGGLHQNVWASVCGLVCKHWRRLALTSMYLWGNSGVDVDADFTVKESGESRRDLHFEAFAEGRDLYFDAFIELHKQKQLAFGTRAVFYMEATRLLKHQTRLTLNDPSSHHPRTQTQYMWCSAFVTAFLTTHATTLRRLTLYAPLSSSQLLLIANSCRSLYHLNVVLPRNESALRALGECRLTSIVLHTRGASSDRVLRHVGKHGTIERVRCDYGYGDSSMAVVRACTRWCPRLLSLRLMAWWSNTPLPVDFQRLAQCCPRLQRFVLTYAAITFEDCQLPEQCVSALISTAPSKTNEAGTSLQAGVKRQPSHSQMLHLDLRHTVCRRFVSVVATHIVLHRRCSSYRGSDHGRYTPQPRARLRPPRNTRRLCTSSLLGHQTQQIPYRLDYRRRSIPVSSSPALCRAQPHMGRSAHIPPITVQRNHGNGARRCRRTPA
jgi:hypothetical protein